MAADLLLVGASTRAAAHSALRGGLKPICVDQFGDVDLRSAAEVVTVADWPAGLPAAIEQLPPCPWMYVGGLENHPGIIAKISESRRLLGNGPEQLALVRDPWRLAETLAAAGLPSLEVTPPGRIPPHDGTWMRKPLRGAGGRGIVIWDDAADGPRETSEACCFQRRAAGLPYSALFLARAAGTSLLGVTRQLVGLRGASAPPFGWCGTLTPVRLPDTVVETMRRIGETLAAAAGLRGLFGCDYLVEDQSVWLTEVNPRYTAAMELLDYEHRASAVAWHASEFRIRSAEFGIGDPSLRTPHSAPRTSGKLVLFADRDLIAGDARMLLRPASDDRLPFVADLPAPGQAISAGQPICTLFAYDRDEESCLARLLRCARHFRRRYLLEPESGR